MKFTIKYSVYLFPFVLLLSSCYEAKDLLHPKKETILHYDTTYVLDTVIITDTLFYYDTIVTVDTVLYYDTLQQVETVFLYDTILVVDTLFVYDTIPVHNTPDTLEAQIIEVKYPLPAPALTEGEIHPILVIENTSQDIISSLQVQYYVDINNEGNGYHHGPLKNWVGQLNPGEQLELQLDGWSSVSNYVLPAGIHRFRIDITQVNLIKKSFDREVYLIQL